MDLFWKRLPLELDEKNSLAPSKYSTLDFRRIWNLQSIQALQMDHRVLVVVPPTPTSEKETVLKKQMLSNFNFDRILG